MVEWDDRRFTMHIDAEHAYEMDAVYNKGVALYKIGRYLESLLYFDMVIENNPDNFDAVSGKAFSLRESGRYVDAVTCFNRMLAIRPNDGLIDMGREFLLDAIEHDRILIPRYNAILACNPYNISALFGRGDSLNHVGRYAEALECFKTAFDIKPGSKYTIIDDVADSPEPS